MCNIKPSDSEDDILPETVEGAASESDVSTSIDDYDDDQDDDDDDDEDDSQQHEDGETAAEPQFNSIINQQSRPPGIKSDEYNMTTVDLSFHPGSNLLALACMSGDIFVYKYELTGNTLMKQIEAHTEPCRGVEYSLDGSQIFAISKDRCISVTDSETGQFKDYFNEAHSGYLYSLSIITEHLFATGDDDGEIKLWDIRHRKPVLTVQKVRDYISSIVTNSSKRYLACTTGEGSVVSINIVARKFHAESEPYESDLTCAGVYRDDTKLVCGTATGKLLMYNWGEFGLHVDEFPGPNKKSIMCQVPLNDNIMITGWEDGKIRATHIHPNKQLGVIGQHQYSVDSLDISHDGAYIASCCSLDDTVSFWPIEFFNNIDLNISFDKNTNLPSSQITDQKNFFADLADN